MRVLLTGATGYVGRNLIPVLQAAGHEVIGTGRHSSAPAGPSIGWVSWDMAAGTPPPPLPGVDAVIHLAQSTEKFPQSAPEIHAVGCTATLHLLDHARRCCASRFIFASTGNVYGFSDRPFAEAAPHRPSSFYAVTKCYAENLVESFLPSKQSVILRLFAPYGPGQTARLIPDIIARVRESRPVVLKGGGQPRLSPIFIDDACRLMTRTLPLEQGLKLNIAGDENAGLREIASIAGEVLGIAPIFEISDDPPGGDLMGDNRAMKTILGGPELVSLREGMRRTILG